MPDHARILIIDDDEDIQDLLFAALDDEGFIVDVAGDGSRGLQLIPVSYTHLTLPTIYSV